MHQLGQPPLGAREPNVPKEKAVLPVGRHGGVDATVSVQAGPPRAGAPRDRTCQRRMDRLTGADRLVLGDLEDDRSRPVRYWLPTAS